MTEAPAGRGRALALLIALALLAHGLGIRNGFVYDDHRFVEQNRALASAGTGALLLDPATQTSDADRDVYRPLRALGHALDVHLWGQDPEQSPFGFHLHSLIAHLVAVLLGYALLRRWLPAPAEGAALLGAGVLALHPLGVEAVGWISSRGDEYALCCGLAALWCYALTGPAAAGPAAGPDRATRGPPQALLLAGAALLAGLAVLGKESAVWVPLVALCHHRLLRRGSGRAVLALAAGALAALLLRQIALSGQSPVQTAPHGGSLWTQAGWALFGTGRTLLALAWPVRLSMDYPQDQWAQWPLAQRLFTALPTLVAVVAAIVLTRRRPAAALLIAWVLLAWLPSSSLLVTLRSLVNDRGAYPLLLPAGALLGLPLARRPRAATGVLLAIAVALVPLSMARTRAFHDDASLWSDVLAANPASVRAHLGLAAVAAATDRDQQGRELAAAVGVAEPDSLLAGIALATLGDFALRVRSDPAGAAPLLQHALELLRRWRDRGTPRPEEAATAAALAEALTLLGRDAEADAVLDRAVAEEPGRTMLHVERVALLLLRAGRDGDPAALQRASEALQAAAAIDPGNPYVQALGQRLAEAQAQARGR